MSEQILEALAKLFALITRQDGGATEVERKFVIDYFKKELDENSVDRYTLLYDTEAEYGKVQENKEISMKDSVRILGFCKKINKNLEQRQKVIILVKLLELVASDKSDKKFTPQRRMIIDTICQAFNIKDDYTSIENFVFCEDSAILNSNDILICAPHNRLLPPDARYLKVDDVRGEIIFKRIPSVDLYFVKYLGKDDIKLNGFALGHGQTNLFPPGSTLRPAQAVGKGFSVYYSDVAGVFLESSQTVKISFTAKDIEYRFPNGALGVQRMNLSETHGKLIGIMGGSGAGKTTLMNVLSGIEHPSHGEVLLNGYNMHTQKADIEGTIGFIAQDDLLLEDLTVYQNLYYNAKLCFKQLSEKEIDERVMTTLVNLGLDHIKEIKVGNVLNKKISGGQRKRLNIALELIREPAIMFVDEPTSGLSSKDSQNVVDLLKELSLKGKLIFVVIHQPSPDIYKTFDKMIILDKGGYLIYCGHPIEAITYFKKKTMQADAERWSENPEEMFKLIEKEVVNEFGQETGKRQVLPTQWHEKYIYEFPFEEVEKINEKPPSSLSRPNIAKQAYLFTVRDFLSKISNMQYLLINLLEAPLLAFLLAYIIRFQNHPETPDKYVFRYNDNVPAYILICIIISLFMGLTVSAEEIIKDRKIQKREQFLNLSRFSYLFSKIFILFTLSGIQTLSFVLVGNAILEIQMGLLLSYWGMLFTVSCFANMLGLNISSMFNSVITIYITIPLLLIPQMILSGIIFRYEKMNKTISERGTVPLLADFMVSRWAFEGMTVNHFMNNSYQRDFYDVDRDKSKYYYRLEFWLKEMEKRLNSAHDQHKAEKKTDSIRKAMKNNLELVKHEIKTENAHLDLLKGFDWEKALTPSNFNDEAKDKIKVYLDTLALRFNAKYIEASQKADERESKIKKRRDKKYSVNKYKDLYSNDGLTAFMMNAEVQDKIIEQHGKLLQLSDPVFNEPRGVDNVLDYRSHFLAPKKHFLGMYFSTYFFNMVVIWLFTFIFYLTLYYDVFKNLLDRLGKIKIGKKE
ncbi:MAG: ATP-binding cassette domain-containing protein [Bacteroidetes bacterium]|nr:MAG: ATP-binding cassette domain-containing protein [Bacteroidota bacterium]